jgi:hypothetical protein
MTDLLEDDPKAAKEQKLVIHENKQDGIYVEGLNEVVVEDPEQCLELMQRGERNRIVRQTHMNAKSSRSHTIFTLLIEEVFPSKKSYRVRASLYVENEDQPMRFGRFRENPQRINYVQCPLLGTQKYQLIPDNSRKGYRIAGYRREGHSSLQRE